MEWEWHVSVQRTHCEADATEIYIQYSVAALAAAPRPWAWPGVFKDKRVLALGG